MYTLTHPFFFFFLSSELLRLEGKGKGKGSFDDRPNSDTPTTTPPIKIVARNLAVFRVFSSSETPISLLLSSHANTTPNESLLLHSLLLKFLLLSFISSLHLLFVAYIIMCYSIPRFGSIYSTAFVFVCIARSLFYFTATTPASASASALTVPPVLRLKQFCNYDFGHPITLAPSFISFHFYFYFCLWIWFAALLST